MREANLSHAQTGFPLYHEGSYSQEAMQQLALRALTTNIKYSGHTDGCQLNRYRQERRAGRNVLSV